MVPAQPTSQCPGCGIAITPGTRFCPNCGKPVQPDNAPKPVASPPVDQHQKKKKRTPAERMRSLVPVLAALAIGFAIGTLNGTAGLIVSIAVGIALGVFFVKRMSPDAAIASLKKNITKIPFIMKIVYMVGVIMLMSIFSVTASKSGLFLPTGHNPSTFVKYLSVVAVLPENLQKTTLLSAFPGHPAFTVPALLIVAIGCMIPERFMAKKWKPIIVLIGMILLTAAPYITHAWLNMKNKVLLDYTPAFYIVWVGFVLVAIDAYLPIILAKMRPSVKGQVMAGMMITAILPLFSMTYLLPPILLQIGGGSFEAEHHFYASLFAGGLSGCAGASVVDDSTSTSEDAPVESSDDGGTSVGTAPSATPVSSFGGDAPSAGTKIPFITGGTAPWELTPATGTIAGMGLPPGTQPVKVAPKSTPTGVGGPNTGMGTTTGTSTGVTQAPTVTTGPTAGTSQGHETGTDTQPPPEMPVQLLPAFWQLPQQGPLAMTPPEQPPTVQPVDDGTLAVQGPPPKMMPMILYLSNLIGDLGTTVLPVVNDIRDGQEIGTGIDVFEGKELSLIGWLTSVGGIFIGSGSGYRKLAVGAGQQAGQTFGNKTFYLNPEDVKKMSPLEMLYNRSPPQNLKDLVKYAYNTKWTPPTTNTSGQSYAGKCWR